MSTDIAVRSNGSDIMEQVLIVGDLGKLQPQQRAAYYLRVCESLNLNPLTQPFEYIPLNGKLTLYATRKATDQLRDKRGVSVVISDRQRVDDLYVVTARATLPDGRTDESIGAVSVKGLGGEALANALMKAETKAKRRVTLSAVGLGWLDESEIGSIPNAQPVRVDMTTGEIIDGELLDTETGEITPVKRWSQAQLNRFWAQLGPLKPKVTGDEMHAILGVASIQDYAGDLDDAVRLVFEARQQQAAPASEATKSAAQTAAGADGEADQAAPDAAIEHPAGSIEAAWQRYTAARASAELWNTNNPSAQVKIAPPPPEREATVAQVNAYAKNLEDQVAKALQPFAAGGGK